MMKKEKPTLYSYCIPIDAGAAPNPYWKICTLAICKPKIRLTAEVGDWIVANGSKNSPLGDISQKIVYAMKITKKMTLQEYDIYCKEKLPEKIPDWKSNDDRRLGDCIYDFSTKKRPTIRKSVHSEKDRERDLSGKYVLLSEQFYYFGNKPVNVPEKLKDIIKIGQGHKSQANDPFVGDFIKWIKGFEKNKLYGKPQYLISKYSECESICSGKATEEALKKEDEEGEFC